MPPPARLPNTAERLASAAVLVVLAAAAVHLGVRQRVPGPAMAEGASIGSGGATAAAAAPARGVLDPWPEVVRPMGAAETFSPATLSDKIDGKAELYLAAGFVSMACQRVSVAAGQEAWMEVFVYDMGAPERAYSVYSAQKRRDAAEAGAGDYAYLSDNQLCLVHGPFYLELVASDAAAATMEAAAVVARAFVERTAVDSHADVGSDEALFPAADMVPGSVALVAADAFGAAGLRDVFVARYRSGAGEATLFIARRETPEAARRAAAEFGRFLADDCGGAEVAAPSAVPGLAAFDLGGLFDCVFTDGPFMAGVHEASDRDTALRLAERLAERIGARNR
jgi:hypothetical protein